ncbi:MAG: hypothetical protein H7257_04210 [Taibaiella sp.]|nr:hypothetical protein [Taibaiella sp.]
MKKVMMALFILIATTSVTAVSARDGKSKKHKTIATKYTCTMHPEVIRSKKGKCPKCGMNLVPVKAPHNNK